MKLSLAPPNTCPRPSTLAEQQENERTLRGKLFELGVLLTIRL